MHFTLAQAVEAEPLHIEDLAGMSSGSDQSWCHQESETGFPQQVNMYRMGLMHKNTRRNVLVLHISLTQLCIALQVIEHCVNCSPVLVLLEIDVVNLASNSNTKDRPENSSYVSYVPFRVLKMDYSLFKVQ